MALDNIPTLGPGSLNSNLDKVLVYKNGGSEVAVSLLTLTNSALNLSGVYLDTINGRMGVGTNAPISTMHIAGLSTFVGASGSTLGSTTANAAAQFYQNGFTGVLGIGGYSNGGAELQSYQSGGTALGGQIILQRQSGSVYIGTPSGAGKLTVQGTGSTSATTSLLVQNSSGTERFKVEDGGNIYFGGGTLLNIGTAFAISVAVTNINSGNNAFTALTTNGTTGNVNILQSLGVGAASPSASARLQVDSTTQGFLKPKMTTAQKNAIVTPAAGLEIYDTDLNRPCFYNGTSWITL